MTTGTVRAAAARAAGAVHNVAAASVCDAAEASVRPRRAVVISFPSVLAILGAAGFLAAWKGRRL